MGHRFLVCLAPHGGAQTLFEICRRGEAERRVLHERPQTTNFFLSSRARLAPLEMCFDLNAFDQIQLAISQRVNQQSCFLASQAAPPFVSVLVSVSLCVPPRSPLR